MEITNISVENWKTIQQIAIMMLPAVGYDLKEATRNAYCQWVALINALSSEDGLTVGPGEPIVTLHLVHGTLQARRHT